jgi:general secretion pathway protein I
MVMTQKCGIHSLDAAFPAQRHARSHRHVPCACSGFTLLEVMIALSIVSIALVAIIGLMGAYVSNLQGLQQRTFAHWVAMNRTVELQLGDAWAQTAKEQQGKDDTSLFPMTWRQSAVETPFERMRKVEITVFDQTGDSEPLTSITTYVGRENRW